MTIAVDMEIRISLLQAVQAVLFFSLLIAVSAWDLRYRIIPDRFQAGIALLSFLNFAPGQLLGALGAVPYLIVALFCKREGGMGGGDIKLMFGAGFFLGAKLTVVAAFIGILLGGGFGALLLAQKKANRKSQFAFGPVLCIGIAMFFGETIADWYMGLL